MLLTVAPPVGAINFRCLSKLPIIATADGEHTIALKQKAREYWLRLILRTRELTPDLKRRIEVNNI